MYYPASPDVRVPRTFVELVQRRACDNPDRCAYSFVREDASETTLTFGELDRRARSIAATLQQLAEAGERALLIYPPGLDFISGFFGCLYAGIVAVPATYPKPRRPMPRLSAIAGDCEATIALTTERTLATLDFARAGRELQALRWIPTDHLCKPTPNGWRCPEIGVDDLAFLQYTSGSTSDPKGVMVSHGNLLHNLEMIRQGFRLEQVCPDPANGTGVFWLPAYHDMGLIGGILEPLYVGGRSVLMSPASFLQRPLRWLRAIQDYGAVVSGAPNFAYELCVRKTTPEERAPLDLSSWQLAFCGAEPIRAETLDLFAEAFAPCGFRPTAYYPCYGMAEATLLVAGGEGPGRPVVSTVERSALAEHKVVRASENNGSQTQKLVGCGKALLNQQIVIAHVEHDTRCPPGRVGEIWIKGPNVARGYWNRPDENQQTFGAHLADTGEGPFLRTGDLGFVSEGQLYVTGRVKDIIIIRGRNLYPQDIELTVENAHRALRHSAGAAFSVEIDGHERLATIQEVDRQHRDPDLQDVIRSIRRAVAEEHELDVYAVVLIGQASLPRTTSGKVQRNLCRQRFSTGGLKVLAQWISNGDLQKQKMNNKRPAGRPAGPAATHDGAHDGARSGRPSSGNGRPKKLKLEDGPLSADEIERLAERIEARLLDWLGEHTPVPAEEVDRDKPFAEYGLDSLAAVELSCQLEDWLKVQIAPVVAWNYPTPAKLALYLAGEAGGATSDSVEGPETVPGQATDDFERLLAEVESLSESEAEAALARERHAE